MVRIGTPLICLVSSLTLLMSGLASTSMVLAGSHAESIKQGKEIAFSRRKGNCLACHSIAGGTSPGNVAPPLVAMQQRYPDKALLRQQIWDATAVNPDSTMPPFGKHQILTESELDKVVDYVHSL